MNQRVRHYDWYRRSGWSSRKAWHRGHECPASLPREKSPLANVLDGSGDAQAEAMWAYLRTAATMHNEKPSYPPTRTEDVVEKLHGVPIPDPYRWLEDGTSAEVKEWVEKQNTFTRSILDKVPGRGH